MLIGMAKTPTERNFRAFLTSQAVSQSGTWLQFVSLAWLTAELTGSGAALGWIAAATFGPLLVLGPLTGALADRVDKHRLLVGTQLLVVAQAVAFGAVILTGTTDMAFLYGLALAFGLLHAVENPVRRAFLAELVDQDRIARAVSINGAITSAGRVVGPVLAGALIASVGIGWCFIATAVSYMVALSALLRIHRSALRLTETVREKRAARAGLRYAWSVPELRIALMLTAVVATLGFNHQVLIPLLAEQTFGGDVGAYTLLYTAIGVGSVVGALLVARRDEIELRFLVFAVIAFAAANAMIALSPNLPLAVIACALTGATASLFVTAAIALLQQRCTPAMRGRVMALSAMVVLGGLPIGGPIIGWICDLAGPRVGVTVGSLTALLAAAAVVHQIPHGRRFGPDRLEESSLIGAS
jgi:MFS family permease